MIPQKITKVIVLQMLLSWLVGFILLLTVGQEAASSAAQGGAVAYLAALAYAFRSGLQQDKTPEGALRAQYAGERFKFLVTVILFSAVFVLNKRLQVIEFFLTYLAMLLVYFAALLME